MSIFKKIGNYVKHPEKIISEGEKIVGIDNPFDAQKDITELVAKEVAKQLPSQIRNLPLNAAEEVVQKAVIPVLEEILKPLEKEVFHVGIEAIRLSHNAIKTLLQSGYKPPQKLINRARNYYASKQDVSDFEHWGRWLWAMGDGDWVNQTRSGYIFDGMTVEEAKEQEKIWAGWEPFVVALEQKTNFSPENLIADYNKISHYVANAGNLSIGFYWRNMYDRAEDIIAELQKYERSGVPITQSAILEFIDRLGPDSIDVTLSAKLEIGISIGGSVGLWGIPNTLIEHVLQEIMEVAHIPA